MSWAFTEEWDTELRSRDPLAFPGYAAKLAAVSGESVRTGLVQVGDGPAVLIEGDFEVIGGSMGLVHGEKVVRAYDRAIAARLPVVIVTRSGGARMATHRIWLDHRRVELIGLELQTRNR